MDEVDPKREPINKYGLRLFAKEKSAFISFYQERLETELMKLEVERKGFIKGLNLRILLAPFVFLLIFYGFRDISIFVVPVVPLMIIGWISVYWMKHKKHMEAKVKAFIMPELVTFMNPDFTYSPENSLLKEDVDATYMFQRKVDSLLGDDLIEGYVLDEVEDVGTNIRFSEVAALSTEKYYTKRGTRMKPLGLFVLGLLFIADFNKDFGDSLTLIKPRWMMKKRKYRKKLREFDKHSSMQEVHLEDPEFSKQFIVHSNDQVEARVILQADTMENILEFVNYVPDTIERKQKRRKRQRFIPYFTFRKNKVSVLIHTRSNHFSLNIMKELTIDTVYDYFKDINLVLRFVDDLNLNLQLYKK